MITTLNGKKVEIAKVDKNSDGSKFVLEAYYLDANFTPLTIDELNKLDEQLSRDGWVE